MTIYHGSEFVIDRPNPNGGKAYNDYGKGFYCTEYADMAREWSVTSEHNGYLNIYDFDISDLRILDLNRYPVMTWLAMLLDNRTFDITAPLAKEAKTYILKAFLIDYSNYDVIMGYRADDSYFSFAQDFISGVISYEQLGNAMRLGRLGDQIVLKSINAFDKIKYIGCEKVSNSVWYPMRESRDRKARVEYISMDKRYIKGALYVTKIIDEEMNKYDDRLR